MDKLPTLPPSVTPPVAAPMSRQPAPARRTRRRRMLVMASATAVFLGSLVVMRYAWAPSEDAAALDEPDRLERSADVAPSADPEPGASTRALETMPVAAAGLAAPIVAEPPTAPALKPQPRKVVTVRPAKTRVAASAKTTATSAVKPTAPIAAPTIANVPARREAPATQVQALSASTESAGLAPVTLTGCLEMSVDRDQFRLTDTDGVDAPRSRSWRTGFLKKRPAPVALIGPSDPHGLEIQVGKRVAATGLLFDHELKVSSVAVVESSCN
jgi:hypothetical protein